MTWGNGGARYLVRLTGVPVAIAENPTNQPLTCGDVVLFGLVSESCIVLRGLRRR